MDRNFDWHLLLCLVVAVQAGLGFWNNTLSSMAFLTPSIVFIASVVAFKAFKLKVFLYLLPLSLYQVAEIYYYQHIAGDPGIPISIFLNLIIGCVTIMFLFRSFIHKVRTTETTSD